MILKSNSNKQCDKASNKLSASEGEGAKPCINIDFFTALVCADIM